MKLNLGALQISSPAFAHGERIPDRHTAEGDDVSPALEWANVPDGTREFVIVCHDPDAPLLDGFTHWVVSGIPGDRTGIAEGGGGEFTEGTTDFGATGYGGPAPPPGHGRHHYFFHLFACGTELGLGPGMTRSQVLDRIDEHVLVQARIVATYDR